MWATMFCPNLSTFAWRRHVGVPREGTNMAATGNQHWEVMLGKFVFITRGTRLIHVLIQELVRKQNLKKKTLFWRLWQFSRSHLNTASWKNNKFNGTLCQNEETSQTENLRKHKFLTALKLRRTDISLVWLRHVKTSYTCNAQQISALKISLALMITYQLYSRVI